jgi:hypothetical protein
MGPILFYVVDGRVMLYVGGQTQTLNRGSSALVRLGDLYAMINDGDTAATLLRLAVTPRDAVDVPIARFETAPPLLLTPVPPPTGALLFRAEIRDYPLTSAQLFLTCLSWETSGLNSGDYRYPGPVGVRVISGSLIVDGAQMLPETGCTLLAANATHTLQGADTAPTVLLFGVIPEGQDLWGSSKGPTQASSSSTPADLTCGSM